MLKNNNKLFGRFFFSMPEGALLNTLKLFSAKCLIIFFLKIHGIKKKNNSRFLPEQCTDVVTKGMFYCKGTPI